MTALIDATNITADAKLRDLELIEFQISDEVYCENVVRRLEDDSALCGVVVVQPDGPIRGMLTRRFILELKLSRGHALDVWLHRPIRAMVEFHNRAFVLLYGDTTVAEAASIAFQRPQSTIYDPVVVEVGPNNYRLLDIPILLVAESQVQVATQQKLREEQEKMRAVLTQLERARKQSEGYARELERQRAEILNQNLALEEERQAAQARSEELATLNSRIVEIGMVFSQRGCSTFAATFAGVDSLRALIAEISTSSEDLSKELREINTIVDLIVEVAGYIRLLSFNAAVEANRATGAASGFGSIAQEIRKLAGRTTEASGRIREVAERIKRKSAASVEAAHSSKQVVQALSEKAQSAQVALDELQKLLKSV